ncbi:glycosyltransferase family 2 protein [Virgibacillus siamensis]|uniref:glycosyltransferase family 2 protein n=1 Tax=Virgibacillus siamensis TaxID=480071 RepID=UPI0009862A6E|nr:glycosyltransferase family 2 protein [Virgibacillus siamensis]
MKDISIIIVNYNTKIITADAIHSIRNSDTSYTYEIILVDNASSDRSVEYMEQQFDDVKIIANDKNLGFAKANNQAIREAEGRYILLLNSDTLIREDTLDMMTAYMDQHPDIGASGCRVVLGDGQLDKACKRGFPTPSASFFYMTGLSKIFPNSRKLNHYHMGYIDEFQEAPVDCLVGAFMMVRKETIDQVGLLDETYFMYGEDIDWCYRIKEAGWRITYNPQTTIIHLKGASNKQKSNKVLFEFHRAMIIFYKKHMLDKYSKPVNTAVYASILAKFILAYLSNLRKKKKATS